jgi:Uma2 family endonuclease
VKAAKNRQFETIADLLHQLGGIAPRRIRATPLPGTATEKDLIALNDRKERLYELVNGVLVEKVTGYTESFLMCELIIELGAFLKQHPLGIVAGADGPMRLLPDLIRLPDISFVSWKRLPGRKVPQEAIADVTPDLAVEILSKGNTKKGNATQDPRVFLRGRPSCLVGG